MTSSLTGIAWSLPAIKSKTFRLLQLVSRHSIEKPNPTKERTLALNIGRARGIDFLIPLNAEGIPAEELNWMLTDLTYVPFFPSWAAGLGQLLKKLRRLEAPRHVEEGRRIAAAQFLPIDVLTSEPEILYSNLVPVASVPFVIHRFRWSRSLSTLERQILGDAWPNYPVERVERLHHRHYSYAIEAPPAGLLDNFVAHKDGGAVWREVERIDGMSYWQVLRPLITRTLVRSMRERGLDWSAGSERDFYFPTGLLKKDRIRYRSHKNRVVTLQVAGQRRFQGEDKFQYNLGFQMDFLRVSAGELAVKFRTRVRISDENGQPFDSAIAANARRKAITRTWFNESRLKQELAVLSFLANGGNIINLGSGLSLHAAPKTELAPFGIDEAALPKGRQLFRSNRADADGVDEDGRDHDED